MTRGNSRSAFADALTTMSLNDGAGVWTSFSRARSATASVMSTFSEIAKSGAVAFDSAIRRETTCCSCVSSWISTRPLAPTASPRCGSGAAAGRPAASASCARLRGAAAAALGGSGHVRLDDAAAGAAALERRQLDAELTRHPPRHRRRLHARRRCRSTRARASRRRRRRGGGLGAAVAAASRAAGVHRLERAADSPAPPSTARPSRVAGADLASSSSPRRPLRRRSSRRRVLAASGVVRSPSRPP